MSDALEDELASLRRVVAAYTRRMTRLGLAALAVSSAGGGYLAVSRLIASGVALASKLERGIVVRVVGAPLVRRRARRRRGAEAAEEGYPAAIAPESLDEAGSLDREATEWEEVVVPSSQPETDAQPFALARMLRSAVGAQRTTFRAISSLSGMVARAVGNATPVPAPPRAFPSQTSLEQTDRGSPESLPASQGTTFVTGVDPALGAAVALRGAASSLVFNLSRSVRATTNMTLGEQAVGAGFVPPRPRPASEGASFRPSAEVMVPPSLTKQSITGRVDTAFRGGSPEGADLGLGAPPASGGRPPDLPLSRESVDRGELSSQVSGPSGTVSGASLAAAPSGSGPVPGLNAGPDVVPGGFNAVMSTPAFAAGTRLSMQVRSLASSGSAPRLPLRDRPETAPPAASAEDGREIMAVVPPQYPSSYPVGAAFSVSGIVASLGLVRSARPLEPEAAGGRPPAQLTPGEAPGMEREAESVGGAFLGPAPEAARASLAAGTDISPAESVSSIPRMETRPLGDAPRSPAPPMAASRAESELSRQLFGHRWLVAVSALSSLGGAMMETLTASGPFTRTRLWAPTVGAVRDSQESPTRGMPTPVVRPEAMVGDSRGPPRASLDLPLRSRMPEESPELPVNAGPVGPGPSLHPAPPPPSMTLSLGRERQAVASDRSLSPPISVWEAVTVLPGILTMPLGSTRTEAERDRPSPAVDASLRAAVGSTTGAVGAEPPSFPEAPAVVRVATSVRALLLSGYASSVASGPGPPGGAAAGGAVPPTAEATPTVQPGRPPAVYDGLPARLREEPAFEVGSRASDARPTNTPDVLSEAVPSSLSWGAVTLLPGLLTAASRRVVQGRAPPPSRGPGFPQPPSGGTSLRMPVQRADAPGRGVEAIGMAAFARDLLLGGYVSSVGGGRREPATPGADAGLGPLPGILGLPGATTPAAPQARDGRPVARQHSILDYAPSPPAELMPSAGAAQEEGEKEEALAKLSPSSGASVERRKGFAAMQLGTPPGESSAVTGRDRLDRLSREATTDGEPGRPQAYPSLLRTYVPAVPAIIASRAIAVSRAVEPPQVSVFPAVTAAAGMPLESALRRGSPAPLESHSTAPAPLDLPLATSPVVEGRLAAPAPARPDGSGVRGSTFFGLEPIDRGLALAARVTSVFGIGGLWSAWGDVRPVPMTVVSEPSVAERGLRRAPARSDRGPEEALAPPVISGSPPVISGSPPVISGSPPVISGSPPVQGSGAGEDVLRFFGLDAITQTLSLVAVGLPSVAQANGVVGFSAARGARVAKAARPTIAASQSEIASPDSRYAGSGAIPGLLEGRRPAPEETVTGMLEGEPTREPSPHLQDEPADERELRRRIEKLLDEELRRHGYQP